MAATQNKMNANSNMASRPASKRAPARTVNERAARASKDEQARARLRRPKLRLISEAQAQENSKKSNQDASSVKHIFTNAFADAIAELESEEEEEEEAFRREHAERVAAAESILRQSMPFFRAFPPRAWKRAF